MKIMIPSLDSDDSDSETDVADFASRPLHLATKTYLQRQSFYRQSFAGTIVQLKDFQFPELCDLLPQFAAEIRHAYLSHITVVVEVWANYDAAFMRFFNDSRTVDCGYIQLGCNNGENLVEFADELRFSTIVLKIGTPFRTLASFRLQMMNEGGRMVTKAKLSDFTKQHPDFIVQFVEPICRGIRGTVLPHGQHGFSLSNLRDFASRFYVDIDPRKRISRYDEEGFQCDSYSANWFTYVEE